MTQKKSFKVEGMSCGGCEDNVVDAVEEIDGVVEANADHENGSLEIEYESLDETAVSMAVEDAGYEVVA